MSDQAGGCVMLAVVLLLGLGMGLSLGHNFGRDWEQARAVKAGAGRWTVDPATGRVEFAYGGGQAMSSKVSAVWSTAIVRNTPVNLGRQAELCVFVKDTARVPVAGLAPTQFSIVQQGHGLGSFGPVEEVSGGQYKAAFQAGSLGPLDVLSLHVDGVPLNAHPSIIVLPSPPAGEACDFDAAVGAGLVTLVQVDLHGKPAAADFFPVNHMCTFTGDITLRLDRLLAPVSSSGGTSTWKLVQSPGDTYLGVYYTLQGHLRGKTVRLA